MRKPSPPNCVFMDEATSAVDEDAERHLHQLVKERLRNVAILSIAHRATVSAFHLRQLHIEPDRQAIMVSPLR